MTYIELYNRDPKIARLLLVNHYFETNSISRVAHEFQTQEILFVRPLNDTKRREKRDSQIIQQDLIVFTEKLPTRLKQK